LGAVAAGSASFALPLVSGAQTAPKLLVGYWPVSAALPFFVAEKMGFFTAAGIDVELVKFADQVKVTEALLAGRIDATATGTGSTQLALAQIAQPNLFKILAANLSNAKSVLDEIIVAKGAPYKKISDLKGKRLATGVGPQAVLEAQLIFAKNGIDTAPMEMSPSQHVASIAAGQIDAAYTYEPNGTVGRLDGTTSVLEGGVRSKYLLGDANAPWYGGAAVLSTDFSTKHPAFVKKYVAGMKRGFDEVRTKIDAARRIYPDYTRFDAKLAEAVPALDYTLYDEFHAYEIGYFQKNYDLFAEKHILSHKLDVASMIYRP